MDNNSHHTKTPATGRQSGPIDPSIRLHREKLLAENLNGLIEKRLRLIPTDKQQEPVDILILVLRSDRSGNIKASITFEDSSVVFGAITSVADTLRQNPRIIGQLKKMAGPDKAPDEIHIPDFLTTLVSFWKTSSSETQPLSKFLWSEGELTFILIPAFGCFPDYFFQTIDSELTTSTDETGCTFVEFLRFFHNVSRIEKDCTGFLEAVHDFDLTRSADPTDKPTRDFLTTISYLLGYTSGKLVPNKLKIPQQKSSRTGAKKSPDHVATAISPVLSPPALSAIKEVKTPAELAEAHLVITSVGEDSDNQIAVEVAPTDVVTPPTTQKPGLTNDESLQKLDAQISLEIPAHDEVVPLSLSPAANLLSWLRRAAHGAADVAELAALLNVVEDPIAFISARMKNADEIPLLAPLWAHLTPDSVASRDWRKSIAREVATILRRADIQDERRSAVLGLLRADVARHREESGIHASSEGTANNRQASLLHHVITAFAAPTARAKVVDALDLSILPGFFNWYDGEASRYEGHDGLLLGATLHQCIAILCERLTSEFIAIPGEYRAYQEILEELANVLYVVPAGEREPYYWRLFGHLREALSYAELATRVPANETGGASQFLNWAERLLVRLLEDGDGNEEGLHPEFVRLVWTSLLKMPNPRRFYTPLAAWAAVQKRPVAAAAALCVGMTTDDENAFALDWARFLKPA